MKCYHCALIDYDPSRFTFQIADAVGLCQNCGEAVCAKHAVKSDVPLPGDPQAALKHEHRVLRPILCADCYQELKSLAPVGV